jgi:WASH complex subunit 7
MLLLRETDKYIKDYHYNLHTQLFHERTTDTKQLKTIGVQQMVYNIRKHGVGILANVTNQLYKFIRKQIQNFCKRFLLDEQIVNLLQREQRIFNRDKDKLNGLYPYPRAHDLGRKIRALVEDTNYLDLMRERLTQIGNTLGFVRMIKNASLKDNQNLLKFIPNYFQEFQFENLAADLAIGGETAEAIKMFDLSVQLMQKQGEDANDYLRNMVQSNEGFADRDEKLAPLKNFFTIVPAISIQYVDFVLRGRDKLSKRNNQNAFISDDGFALGVAFMLRILGTADQFNGLNWFDSVNAKFMADLETAEAKRTKKEPQK